MGAAGAQQRRSANDLRKIRLDNPRFFAPQSPRDEFRSKFADPGDFILADAGNPGSLDLFLKIRFQFLHHIQDFDRRRKGADFFQRQRIGKSQFQVGSLVAEHFPGILVSDAGSHDADASILPLDPVKVGGFREIRQLLQPLFHGEPALASCCGN